MSVIGEVAISAFLELLLGKLASSGLNFVASNKKAHKQLKEWQSNLQYIQAVLNDAEEKQIKDDRVKNWLVDLQDLAYDVDDILDEFAYEDLRLKLQKTQAQASTSKIRKLILTCYATSSFNPTAFMFNQMMNRKIEDITTRFNHLTTLRSNFGLSANTKEKKRRLQPTSAIDEAVEYVGRENQKREILELLKSCDTCSNHAASVISIHGMGGMGKTTLVGLVYNDEGINNSFDYKAWVCVSDDFDAIKITKTILRQIDQINPKSGDVDDLNLLQVKLTTKMDPKSGDDDDLDLLQVKLKEKLSGKRFLLVLDDFWNEDYDDWTKLRSVFGVGTKIIVTTRSRNVSRIVATLEPFDLHELSHDDCLSIFTQHALIPRNFNGLPELKEVGGNIVRRCNGLPLAAKAIGGLLRSKRDPGEWEKIYESEIWDLPEDQCGIIPALQLSYYHLPSHLKRCFAYCSILPKGYEFDEEEIILLWRAEDLLEKKVKSQIKNFGNQCFHDLMSRSFFQTSSNNKSRYVMHELINDLAQSVARDICSKVDGDKQSKISSRTRHSSYVKSQYDIKKMFDAFDKAKSLRTFLPFKLEWRKEFYLTYFVLDDLLPILKCLRVLSLNGYRITELSDFFEDLKHLHYVDFSETRIKCLPNSLCTLYHLQTLILRKCELLEKLPSRIGNLMQLHYLDIRGADSITGMPSEIGKLTNLQRLSNFILRKADGYLLRELKNLSNLSGDFCISGLENSKGQHAREAKLNEKSGIDKLALQWSTDFDIRIKEEEEQVLDCLRPQKKLEHLTIESYGGAKFSAWIADSSFKNLLCLRLHNCINCKSLPSIGRLAQLKDLFISAFNEVIEVGVEFFGENEPSAFTSLERLNFRDMPNWKKWDPCEGDEQVLKFPGLHELCIVNCPQLLGRLPTRLYSLHLLEIFNCDRLVVSISSFTSLHRLLIKGCEELVDKCSTDAKSLDFVLLEDISKFSIPRERIMSRFKNLKVFITGGKEMTSLSQYGFGLLGYRGIVIEDCPRMVSLETEEMDEEKQQQLGKSSSIKLLKIRNCESLNRLPKGLHALKSIMVMYIMQCPSLVCFAENNLPPTLEKLTIEDCKNLKYLVGESEKKSSSNSCFPRVLTIKRCPSLICLSSSGDLTNGLQVLEIINCSNMTSLFANAKLPLALKRLFIWECPELECIAQDFHETTALGFISILCCHKIKSLPRGLDRLNHLQEIRIFHCSSLVPFEDFGLPPTTNLRVFYFAYCKNFGAFPNCINKFTSLQELKVINCSIDISFPEEGFPTNLTVLDISNAPKICRSLLERGLHRLTSLQRLEIGGEGCSDVVSFSNMEMMLPASLTHIVIKYFENLEYMFSGARQNLTSLQTLCIFGCPKLTALPEKGMLLLLEVLEIRDCPLLKKKCQMGKRRKWSKIAHIPLVKIDDETIIPRGFC